MRLHKPILSLLCIAAFLSILMPRTVEASIPTQEPITCAVMAGKGAGREVLFTVEHKPAVAYYSAQIMPDEQETDHIAETGKMVEPWYTADELEWLACVIYNEAGSDSISDETRLMVGCVVLNRVADPRFPDTIYEVLTQERQYGLFHWTGIKWADRAQYEPEAVERARECARRALDGERVLTETVVWQSEFVQGKIAEYQDGIYFCW